MIVLDASVVIDLLLDVAPVSDRIAEHVRAHDGDLHAPHLLDAEVGQVFRRFILRGDLTAERAHRAIERLGGLPLTRYPHLPFLHRALELRGNLTVYDALYLVLAEALGAPLLTRDEAIASAPGDVSVIVVDGHSGREESRTLPVGILPR